MLHAQAPWQGAVPHLIWRHEDRREGDPTGGAEGEPGCVMTCDVAARSFYADRTAAASNSARHLKHSHVALPNAISRGQGAFLLFSAHIKYHRANETLALLSRFVTLRARTFLLVRQATTLLRSFVTPTRRRYAGFPLLYVYKIGAGRLGRRRESWLRTLYRISFVFVLPGFVDHFPCEYERKTRASLEGRKVDT